MEPLTVAKIKEMIKLGNFSEISMVVGKIPIVIFIGSASQPIETTLALKLSSFLTPLLYQFGFSTVDVFVA